MQATSGTGDREQTAPQTITVTVMDDDNEAPSAPDAPSVSPASVTSLNVNWTEPGLNGGPEITGYEVQYRAGTSGDWTAKSHTGIATTATLTGLSENTSYQVAGAGHERRGHERLVRFGAAAGRTRTRRPRSPLQRRSTQRRTRRRWARWWRRTTTWATR